MARRSESFHPPFVVWRWKVERMNYWDIKGVEKGGKNDIKIYFCCCLPMHQPLPSSPPFRWLFPFSFPAWRQLTFADNSQKTFTKFQQILLFPSLLCCFFLSYSLFSPLSERAHRHFDTQRNFQPNLIHCGAKLRLTSHHCSSSGWRTPRLKFSHRNSPREIRANCKSCATWNFFLCSHTQSLLFFLYSRITRISKKSSFHCQPDNANVCCVVAFLPSIHWVRLFSSEMKALGHAHSCNNKTTRAPNYHNIYSCMRCDDVQRDPQFGATMETVCS